VLTELGLRRDQVAVDVVTEGKSGIFGIGAEPAIVRVTPLEAPADTSEAPAAAGANVSRETTEAREGEDGESRPRRRRGRRGGRGRRRGGENGAATAEASASNGDDADHDDADHDDAEAGEAVAAAPRGGNRSASTGDSGGERAPRGERGDRGGRGRSGGRGRGGSSSRGGRGRDRDRDGEGSGEPIEGVSDDEAIPVPGSPEELPYSPIEDPADDVDLAGSTLRDILTLLGYADTQITAREPETPGDGTGLIEQIFDIYGNDDDTSDELGVLIGRRGETLSAVQYLVNTIVSKGGNKPPVFGVDIEGYRRRREEMLVDLARDIAQEVRETGDVITLEPMPAHERRIVHIALREEEGVRTESVGSGEDRQVEILPDD